MSRDNNTSCSVNINFGGLLGIVFITLKLCHVIGWSWWWVLAPFWIPFSIWLIYPLVVLIVALFNY